MATYHLQVAKEAEIMESREVRLNQKKVCDLLDGLECIQLVWMNSRQTM